MDYLTFRYRAMQSLSLTKYRKGKDRFPPYHWSKGDIENWIRREYLRHYPEDNSPQTVTSEGLT